MSWTQLLRAAEQDMVAAGDTVAVSPRPRAAYVATSSAGQMRDERRTAQSAQRA